MQYCFSTLTFWFERASSIDQLTWLPYMFFSGLVIPLADMPAPLRQALYFTPFPYCIDFPARILTRQLAMAQPRHLPGLCRSGRLVRRPVAASASFLWKRGLLQYSGHGA